MKKIPRPRDVVVSTRDRPVTSVPLVALRRPRQLRRRPPQLHYLPRQETQPFHTTRIDIGLPIQIDVPTNPNPPSSPSASSAPKYVLLDEDEERLVNPLIQTALAMVATRSRSSTAHSLPLMSQGEECHIRRHRLRPWILRLPLRQVVVVLVLRHRH